MLRRLLATGTILAGLLVQNPAGAATAEQWEAISTTAMSITGNVTFSPDKITFQNGASLPLALVGHAAGFDVQGQRVPADLYKVTAPADPALLRGNRLCGGGPTQQPVTYIATWPVPASGGRQGRGIDVFSGPVQPQPTGARTGECGTFFYETAAVSAPAAAAAPGTGAIDCPDVVAGHRLGVVDVFDGPPADQYAIIPNQPGKRDIWPSLDKGQKPVFVICRYQGGQNRQFQLSRSIKSCTALRAPNDVHTGLTCQ